LINKKVGSNLANSHLQKVDYRYSIRGWLKGINDVNTFLNGSEPEDLFAFKISYNEVDDSLNGDIKALYNGNISETSWRSASDGVLRRYGFMYDHLNRLSDAIYQKPETTGADNSYNESIRYDMNGNIQELLRNGYLDGDGSAVLPIDNLAYVYQFNHLYSVTDYTMSLDGFKDGNQQGYDYDYDANGNMRKDLNKGISSITYNHLNLPVYMDFGLNKNITYLYNALGVKLSKIVTAAGKSTITQYSNGFQYQDGVLQHFSTAEGYVSVVEGRINYVYNYTDHLGNIRLSYGLDPEEQGQVKILSENHYYPYGLKHSNYNAIEYAYKENELGTYVVLDPTERSDYRYKYNGQEWQDELGLNVTAMDFRQYDNAIGRFNGMDALSEIQYSHSPYHFGYGNPMYFADPSGLVGVQTNYEVDWLGRQKFDQFGIYITPDARGPEVSFSILNYMDGGDGYGGIRDFAGNYYRDSVTGAIYANVYHQAQYGDESEYFDFNGLNELGGITLPYWEKVYLDFNKGFWNADRSNMSSASALTGYAGLHLEKTAALLKFVGAADNVLKATKTLGQKIGVAGAFLTGMEGLMDGNGLTAGDVTKVAIGLITTFTPYGWVYGAIDLGFGITTGTTLTDRIGYAIDNY